jgi:hypothetical protein
MFFATTEPTLEHIVVQRWDPSIPIAAQQQDLK